MTKTFPHRSYSLVKVIVVSPLSLIGLAFVSVGERIVVGGGVIYIAGSGGSLHWNNLRAGFRGGGVDPVQRRCRRLMNGGERREAS